MSEISKAYEPQSVEDKWYAFWLKAVASRRMRSPPSPRIPSSSAAECHRHAAHGAVLNNTIQDILSARPAWTARKCSGAGTDHAGIATQMMVEKQLKKEEKKSRHDLGREEF